MENCLLIRGSKMPRTKEPLSEKEVSNLTFGRKGTNLTRILHAVGGAPSLYLQCSIPSKTNTDGSKSWILRCCKGKTRTHLGLGSYPFVSLAEARDLATKIYKYIDGGFSPQEAKIEAKKIYNREDKSNNPKFSVLAKKYIDETGESYKSVKQYNRLKRYFDDLVLPYIGDLRVDKIEQSDLITMLNNYYYEIPETAVRVINHTRKIIRDAIISGYRKSPNPAVWDDDLSHHFNGY